MLDSTDLQIQPTAAVNGAHGVRPVRGEAPVATPEQPKAHIGAHPAAATTEGHMRAAYAQFVVNPDTHHVVIRVRDSATDQVLSEFPSEEVEAMSKFLRDYGQALARHRAALHAKSAA
jgi:hypothetical protein